ncbi:glycosyl-4,4'-diaponeurosporenoate acyltransferase CrtO family protein [Brumimicrobium aurantiacum]|uniref:glycosyl-4,4'-diaponeurosporenoate acyltransferase CrtO family protein n=1 Tax=Brumimicrobium aurantiacum TaxID=1737063 RepID=UPI000F509D35|nr:hypothetical protein [Brumimicrobium aurantiacum]
MKQIKRFLFPLISLFLIYRLNELYNYLISTDPTLHQNGSLLFYGFLITLYATGIFAFIGFAYPTYKIIPPFYYKINHPIRLKKISKILGVHYFRYLLMIAFWGHKKNRKKYFNGTKNGLNNFNYQTKQSEFGHFGAMVLILVLSFGLIYYKYYFLVLIITFINIVGNLYPILLQRLHRERISKLTDRIRNK